MQIILLAGWGFFLGSSILALLCLLVAFCREIPCLVVPYIAYHVMFCLLTVVEVAVHVYYTNEGISVEAVVRVTIILVTSCGIFLVLVYKKVLEMVPEPPILVKEMERPPNYNDQPKNSAATFIHNPNARASIASSHQIDNWVPSPGNPV